jgi:hypothetical protein
MMGGMRHPMNAKKSDLKKQLEKSTVADRITLLSPLGKESKETTGYVQKNAVLVPSSQLPSGWSVEEIVFTADGETNVGRVNGWKEYKSSTHSEYTKIKVIKQ